MKTRKFSRKPFDVEAVQVTEENFREVAEWCEGEIRSQERKGEEVEFIKVKVYLAAFDRQTKAYVGDWVLKTETGFKVYTQSAFDKTFVENPGPTPSVPARRDADVAKDAEPTYLSN